MQIDIPKKFLKKIFSIEGQITKKECGILFTLASKVTRGIILEVGSFRGRSTVALAMGTMWGSHLPVYAIEPHEPFTGVLGGEFGPSDRVQFFKNMLKAKVVETVRLVNLSSEVIAKGWDRDIGLLWLDGDHTFEGVKRDFESWIPHVIRDGIVAFHDSANPELGPYKLIKELEPSGKFEKITRVDETTVLRKL